MAKDHPRRKALMAVGLIASIAPDFDLFWFYLVDGRQTNHHDYIFHWPLFWAGLALLAWLLCRLFNWHGAGIFILVALANMLLHMALDSIAADIYWLRPISTLQLNLVEVPARYGWWVWNFVLHWTFLLELSITISALAVFWHNLRAGRGFATKA